MSHGKKRAEKICLNCGAELHGHYCHNCGQENIEPKESFLHLVKHFFYDITHFDGKFLETVKDLLLKPGFLSKEYMAGKRARYLNPIKMYVFTSAIFFLIFFSFIKPQESIKIDNTKETINYRELLEKEKVVLKADITDAENDKDTSGIKKQKELLALVEEDLILVKKDSTAGPEKLKSLKWFTGEAGIFFDKKYRNKEEYVAAMNAMPVEKRDSWFKQLLIHKSFDWKQKYGDNKEIGKIIFEKFLHSVPQLLFVSLPFVALFLKLLYIRRRKQFYYADHGIFSIHLYCAIFSLLLIIFGINKIESMLNWGWLGFISGLSIFFIFIYFFMAMRRFYGQGFFKTFFKYIFLLFLVLMLMGILMTIFLFLSFVKA